MGDLLLMLELMLRGGLHLLLHVGVPGMSRGMHILLEVVLLDGVHLSVVFELVQLIFVLVH